MIAWCFCGAQNIKMSSAYKAKHAKRLGFAKCKFMHFILCRAAQWRIIIPSYLPIDDLLFMLIANEAMGDQLLLSSFPRRKSEIQIRREKRNAFGNRISNHTCLDFEAQTDLQSIGIMTSLITWKSPNQISLSKDLLVALGRRVGGH